MRIVAGTYRSRILKSLRGAKLRPTSDRLRETLFDILGAGVEGARFVDVYAGTGAIGIEALSRGAAEVIFIENHAPAANLIRQNLASLGITTGATVFAIDAVRGLDRLAARMESDSDFAADFIYLDPPYAEKEEYTRALRFLGGGQLIAPCGRVIAEHRRDFALPEKIAGLRRVRFVRQGDAALSLFQIEQISE